MFYTFWLIKKPTCLLPVPAKGQKQDDATISRSSPEVGAKFSKARCKRKCGAPTPFHQSETLECRGTLIPELARAPAISASTCNRWQRASIALSARLLTLARESQPSRQLQLPRAATRSRFLQLLHEPSAMSEL